MNLRPANDPTLTLTLSLPEGRGEQRCFLLPRRLGEKVRVRGVGSGVRFATKRSWLLSPLTGRGDPVSFPPFAGKKINKLSASTAACPVSSPPYAGERIKVREQRLSM